MLEAEHLIHAATLQRLEVVFFLFVFPFYFYFFAKIARLRSRRTEGESREMETFEKAIELLRQLYLSAGETAEPYVARWHGQALAQKGQALETDGEKQEALEAVVEGELEFVAIAFPRYACSSRTRFERQELFFFFWRKKALKSWASLPDKMERNRS